jgi:hypothetical protein
VTEIERHLAIGLSIAAFALSLFTFLRNRRTQEYEYAARLQIREDRSPH